MRHRCASDSDRLGGSGDAGLPGAVRRRAGGGRADRGADGAGDEPRSRCRASPACSTALAEQGFAELPLDARTQVLHGVAASSHEARLGVIALRNATFLFFYGLADEHGPQSQLGRARLSRPDLGPPVGRAGAEDDRGHGSSRAHAATLTADGVRRRLGRRRRRDRRRARSRPGARWSCSRWAATATRPTSSSSSCRACSSCTWAAGCSAPRMARSRSWPARRSAAARSSTT